MLDDMRQRAEKLAPEYRQLIEDDEEARLAPGAARARATKGRARPEAEDRLRTAFQRDRDRILHAKAFRRLAGKTQVFLAPEGDHYRTRITHTLEVAQVARTIARCLRLNEDLTEAMALGHDLGHTPFGHSGEHALAHLVPGGFHHARQSLRVVEQLEKDGRGLNLTLETRDGILKHSKGRGPIFSDSPNSAFTLEGQVVRVSDIIAYANHDLDDAVRAGLLALDEIPVEIRRVIGTSRRERLTAMIRAVVDFSSTEAGRRLSMDEDTLKALIALREFLYARVYENPLVHDEFEKAKRVLGELWKYFHDHADEFRDKHWPTGTRPEEGLDRAITDHIAGMTDRFALRKFRELLLPKRWGVY